MNTTLHPQMEANETTLTLPWTDAAAGRHGARVRRRQSIGFLAKLILAAAILSWLVSSGRVDMARLLRLSFSWQLLALLALVLLAMFLPALRWWYLLRIQQLQVSLWSAVRLTWVSYFAALFLPGAAGADIAKAFLIVKNRSTGRLRALSTILVDRFLGLYSVLSLGGVAAVWSSWQGDCSPALWTIIGTTLVLLTLMTLFGCLVAWSSTRNLALWFLPSRWRDAIHQSWSLYRNDTSGLAGCLLLSLVSNIVVLLGFVTAASAVRLPTSLATVFHVGPLVVLANCLPFTPGGTGVGEAASDQLFSSLGFVGGAEVMLLFRVVTILASLPAALITFLTRVSPA